MLSGPPLTIPESSLSTDQRPAPATNMQKYYNQPSTGECFRLTSLCPGLNAITPVFTAHEQPSSLRTFGPQGAGEGSYRNLEIGMSVIQRGTSEVESHVTIKANTTGEVHEATIQGLNQKTETGNEGDQNRIFQQMNYLEDYLQPVESENLQVKYNISPRLCDRKPQTSTPRPQPKPRLKVLRRETEQVQHQTSSFSGPFLNLQVTDLQTCNPPYEIEIDPHCACVNPQMRTFHGYQNGQSPMTSYQNTADQSSLLQPPGKGESPYTRVNCNTNWELPCDHLSLFERIGGGSFGEVWKGTACDVIGAKGWSVVAVKMLKGKD